ncbi:AraC family transcriptional regulator [Sphingomonas corticis]|jgi:AraC-like DNA-binding protein|uniref:AraC family transcriptional regulator n=1 Tax=Sphingomonas corticis TaxID=2722791 RepID=A0ABX1CLC6_9SPHN|nr:helix-turn-helix domain-containing protein [Sphingomonas corticis]NJR77092.1 AraC family transcriptional regulator [Sphingomonas corticis]
MIESGTHTVGVRVEDFGLPPGTALRVDLPAPALRPFLTHYHVLDSDPGLHDGVVSWALPGWPLIRLILTDAPMTLRIGNRLYDPIPPAALYGFASRARQMTTHGGVTVGIGLTPLGWARMIAAPADRLRDQVVPLEDHLPATRIAALRRDLRDSDGSREVAALLDAFFAPLLAVPNRAEAGIEMLMRLVADDRVHDIATASEAAGMSQTTLRRLATRYFGFPPKTLLVQQRFLRSLRRMLMAGNKPDYSQIAPTYFDKSHFLRDADRFLGMTPRRFMLLDNRYMLAVMRARTLVTEADRAGDDALTMAR